METKQEKAIVLMSALALVGLVLLSPLAPAGDLEPSAPPGPTMKTLDEVEPRIPIPSSATPTGAFTISQSGSYYLTGDRLCSGTGISVDVDDVTIDLMGYRLSGPGSGTNYGINMHAQSNVEIRNGTVSDFGSHGINEYHIDGNYNRIINVRTMSNGGMGIRLGSPGSLIKDCTAAENVDDGIFASSASTVTGNTSRDNGGDGIYASTGSTITGNSASKNGENGISANIGCTVTDNTACYNGANGISAHSGCTVFGNTARQNTGDGIRVSTGCKVSNNNCSYNGYDTGDGAGIHATHWYNRIEANNVTNNDRGIDVDKGGNLIVRNSESSNTTSYDIVVGNKVGTISTDPTTAEPWDNFSF